MDSAPVTPLLSTAVSPLLITEPAPPPTTTVASPEKSTFETETSQIEEPTSPTTAPVLNQLELRIPKTHMSQKQTALTNFYTIQPLHIIETHSRTHKSQNLANPQVASKRRSSSTFPTPTMSTTPRQPKRSKLFNIAIPHPSDKEFQVMACAAGITGLEIQRAYDLTLQTLGYTVIPRVTPQASTTTLTPGKHQSSPRATASPDNAGNVLDLTQSPIKKMATLGRASPPTDPSNLLPFMAQDDTSAFSYKSPATATFTPKLERGANKWVSERDTFRVLQRYHNFRATVPTSNLVLTCNINNLEHLFLLVAEIAGTKLTTPHHNSPPSAPNQPSQAQTQPPGSTMPTSQH
jgi:hypothetical protein